MKRGRNPTRDEAILLLLLDTGLRVSELCGLTCGNVDLTGNLITVIKGKRGKNRYIPFSSETKRAIFAYLKEMGPE